MKKILFIITLLISTFVFGQISVGPSHIGGKKKFKKGQIAKFKKTTTVFVINSSYTIEEFEGILKDSWKVTPFIVVNEKDFNLEDYFDSKYSFVMHGKTYTEFSNTGLNGLGSRSFYTNYLKVFTLDIPTIKKKLEKVKKSKYKKLAKDKTLDILLENQQEYGIIYLYSNSNWVLVDVLNKLPKEEQEKITREELIEKAVHFTKYYNYSLGMLKNYFQVVSNTLQKGKDRWLYEKDFNPALKKLASQTLYVPDFILDKHNANRRNNTKSKIFDSYKYDYKVISSDELSEKILNNEDIYYLNYTWLSNNERYIRIVNAKTGNTVYRSYKAMANPDLQTKHINKINSKIKKALKK